jgi:ubiquinone/menaquinone biosynthesis C-methylase UbiE
VSTTGVTTGFDPVAFKRATQAEWDDAADAWHRWAATIEAWLEGATAAMLDLVGARPGAALLDVAAGAGGQTLAAARRVGPTGSVLATDIAPAILEHAEREAHAAGLGNVQTAVMDGEDLDTGDRTFDGVICRLGLMFFPHPVRSLELMRRALRDGGRVAVVVWARPERNRFFSIPTSVLRRRAGLPAPGPGMPGAFALAEDGALEHVLERAGFRELEVQRLDAPMRMRSAAECVRFERESFAALRRMSAELSPEDRDAAWEEIRAGLEQFEDRDGFAGECELLVAAGMR